MAEEKKIKLARRLQGKVVSAGMQKTVVVLVSRAVNHPIYRKQYTVSRKFKAHDEKQSCRVGQSVIIEECRPLSRDKRWRVIEIVNKK
jgi:small subunit ribosomal protein S17